MNLRMFGAIVFGTLFMLVNALVLFLTSVWLRFSVFEPQIIKSAGNFTIPGSRSSDTFATIDILFYQAMPFGIAPLLIVSSACLFVTVRLSK